MHACVLNHVSRIRLFTTLWTIAHQVPLSMGFSRQEYWSGLPFPPPGYHSDPRRGPGSLMSPPLAGRSFTTSTTWGATSQSMPWAGSSGLLVLYSWLTLELFIPVSWICMRISVPDAHLLWAHESESVSCSVMFDTLWPHVLYELMLLLLLLSPFSRVQLCATP